MVSSSKELHCGNQRLRNYVWPSTSVLMCSIPQHLKWKQWNSVPTYNDMFHISNGTQGTKNHITRFNVNRSFFPSSEGGIQVGYKSVKCVVSRNIHRISAFFNSLFWTSAVTTRWRWFWACRWWSPLGYGTIRSWELGGMELCFWWDG